MYVVRSISDNLYRNKSVRIASRAALLVFPLFFQHIQSCTMATSFTHCKTEMTSNPHLTPIKIKSEVKRQKLENLNWIDLSIPPQELRPMNTLTMGQCFNWKQISVIPLDNKVEGYWTGTLFNLPLIVRQLSHTTEFTCLVPLSQIESTNLQEQLVVYFQTQQSLLPLYEQWTQNCHRMSIIASFLPGVRVLRQEPWECLVSFICSSNNNIARITLMLDKLRAKFGKYICSLSIEKDEFSDSFFVSIFSEDSSLRGHHLSLIKSPAALRDEAQQLLKKKKKKTKRKLDEDPLSFEEAETSDITPSQNTLFHYYTFPTPHNLMQTNEEELRQLGMGYRAKFILNTAKIVSSKPEGSNAWFEKLRTGTFSVEEETAIRKALKWNATFFNKRLAVQHSLLELSGVGRKVADCVALFSLDQYESIPVDTHVWDIAVRDYAPRLQEKKSLTPIVYEEVGDVFRNLFRSHAGWAHSVLFAAELPAFRKLLPEDIQQEMIAFAALQRKKREDEKSHKKIDESGTGGQDIALEQTKLDKSSKSEIPKATRKKVNSM